MVSVDDDLGTIGSEIQPTWSLERTPRLLTLLLTGPENLGMQIVALLIRRFDFFDRNAVGVGIGVMADSRHLDFDARLAGLNHEPVVADLLHYNRLGRYDPDAAKVQSI